MPNSHSTTDRNLLFGILAVQMDFIDRDQLVAAMNAWVLDKSRPIEDIFTSQAAIADDEKHLLVALVKKHLEKHGNDPEKSLAAVGAVGSSVRGELALVADADVQDSLAAVAAADQDGDDPYATTSFSFGSSTSEGDRFRVLRPHAKGGLGEVFVARDEELHREVALKHIQSDYADDPHSRARFVMEAEITGGLEHPGIVPVYGLGQYADGRPFYAMRFIRGDSLEEAIGRFHKLDQAQLDSSEWTLQLRKLLGRFIDVCDAVEYAHSRGVLHRDLKPGNVMLGKYGETLLVDWGLAKVIGAEEKNDSPNEPRLQPVSGSGSAPTQMGSALGTPSYMSPEQAAGRLDLLGPSSDVYSLGATLYSLLVGQASVKKDDVATILRKVQNGDFPRPREVKPSVPAALEAICLKAMARVPPDRYASPHALSEDIEHWLADEPVSAYRDPLLSRAGRWARRHKVAVATVTVVLLTAVVCLSIGAVLLTGANRRIREAQQLAERNEQTANQNFRLARKAVDDYLTTVSQETLLDKPGMQPLRQELLDHALRYYQEFITHRADDPQLQLELRDANFLVGRITQQIGSHEEAVGAFRRALELNQRLVDRNPSQPLLRHKLARCYYSLGSTQLDSGQLDDALESYNQSIHLLEELVENDPDDLDSLSLLGSTFNSLGIVYRERGDLDQTIANYQKSLAIDNQLMEADDDNAEHQNSYAGSCHNLAMVYHETGQQDDAIKQFRQAIEIRLQLLAEFPSDPLYQNKLTLSYNSLANTLADVGRYADAEEFHQKTIKLRERLVGENPAVTEYHDELAGSYSNLASLYREMGQPSRASELNLKSITIWQRLADQHPQIVQHRASLGTSFYNLGNLLYATQPRQAVEHYQNSIKIRESMVSEFPEVPEYQAALASSYNNCAAVANKLGDTKEAGDLYRKARELREQLVAHHPHVPDYRNVLASTYLNLAQFGFVTDDDEALELLGKAVEQRQSLVEKYPGIPHYQSKLALTYRTLGNHYSKAAMGQEALAAFAQAIALRENLVAAHPKIPTYRYDLANCCSALAVVQGKLHLADEATATSERALEILTQLAVEDPDNRLFERDLAAAHLDLARLHASLGNFAEGLVVAKAVVQRRRQMAERESTASTQLGLAKALQILAAVQRLAGQGEEADDTDQQATAVFESLISNYPENRGLMVVLADTLIRQAHSRVLAGAHAQSSADIDRLLKELDKPSPVLIYNAACIFSLAIDAAQRDTELSKENREILRQRYTDRAMSLLRAARDAGFFSSAQDIKMMAADTDFDAIRKVTEYEDFVKALQAEADDCPR